MKQTGYKTTITSKHKLFNLHLRETFQYRDLIALFVKRDFTALYKQTILGPLWAVIQPLLTTIVFSFIFGSLARLTTLDTPNVFELPGFLFYMSGTMMWHYFAINLEQTSKTFITNRSTMGKVYYPRLVQPIATSISNLISFGIQFLLFLVIWAIYLISGSTDITVTPWMCFLPLIILQLMVLSTGFGMVISAMTTKYRDLQMLVGFGLQLWQYASPVAYGLTLISTSERFSNFLWLYMLNPMTPTITTFRYAMFGHGYFDIVYYLIGWGTTIFVFLLGLILFSKTEKNFMDTI